MGDRGKMRRQFLATSNDKVPGFIDPSVTDLSVIGLIRTSACRRNAG